MEPTGEHFTPLRTSFFEMQINMDRYFYVLPQIEGKVIMDLGCGCGLGTYLYSALAKEVIAVDYNTDAIQYASKFPPGKAPVRFIHPLNLEKEEHVKELPEVDICIALEVLEHLADPAMVLKNLKAKRLIFSIPLHSMEMSTWHKFPTETIDDIRKLISPFYDCTYHEQRHENTMATWVFGEGVRVIQ